MWPKIPLKKEGILGNSEVFHDTLYLMDPPTSEPMPNGVPAAPMRAPSPPDEPPAVRPVWYGLQVLPYTGLAASIHMQSSETLVTARGIPPALRRAAAVGESSVALIPFLQSFKWNYLYW